jgi:hypothetical protein
MDFTSAMPRQCHASHAPCRDSTTLAIVILLGPSLITVARACRLPVVGGTTIPGALLFGVNVVTRGLGLRGRTEFRYQV